MNYNKEFFDFLKSAETQKNFKRENYNYYIVKISYNEKIDLLYGDNLYRGEITFDSKLEYEGFYDKEKDELYYINYDMYNILGLEWRLDSPYLSMSNLINGFNQKLNNIITDYVKTNKKEFYEAAKDYISDIEEKDIYNNFINNLNLFDYESHYEIDDKKIILDYFIKGDKLLYGIASDYTEKNKERIGEILKDNDVRNKLLSDINNNLEHKIHKRKDIVSVLKDSEYKRVNTFIFKDGKYMNFKIDTSALERSWNSSYVSQYSMDYKDREKFEKVFGSRQDFNLDDIYKIEFRNKSIYEDTKFNFDIVENKEEELSL